MSTSNQMSQGSGNHTELSSSAGTVLSSLSVWLILEQGEKGNSPTLFSYI